MSFIKSALEIALEKTDGIKGDRSAILAQASRDEGRRLASAYLADPTIDLAKRLKETPAEKAAWVREGFLASMQSNFSLPRDAKDLERVGTVFGGFEAVATDKNRVRQLKQQVLPLLKQCLDDKKRLNEGLVQQFKPILRKKEEQLARQYGRAVRIDPFQDPDFLKALNQNLGSLEAQYEEVLSQARAELDRLAGLGSK